MAVLKKKLLVSNQILAEDVRNLRAGLEDVKTEKEKEPDNFILFVSPTFPVSMPICLQKASCNKCQVFLL